MKRLLSFLIMVILVNTLIAVQPARKPFLQIKVDGVAYKSGGILTVTSGQKLTVNVELEGGRRDFCKFPDTYADITGTAQILSRGNDGLSYELDGIKAEWKLLSQKFLFAGDEFVTVKSQADQSNAEITISSAKFSQSFVKVTAKATWQFIREGKTIEEENLAEGTVYFKIAGSSDVWFSSPNVQAGGMRNEGVEENLVAVQAQFDSIENHFYKMNFSAIQQSVKTLQTSVNEVKTTIDEVKKNNTSYKANFVFIGLPSDKPYQHISFLASIKTDWGELDPLLQDIKLQLGKLPAQSSKENQNELLRLIGKYADWQQKLPENTFKILPRYMPEITLETVQIPESLRQKSIGDYSQSLKDYAAFVDRRIEQATVESQKISSTQSRLQAVRLFDGMLRSYFSSINWAEWKNTRE